MVPSIATSKRHHVPLSRYSQHLGNRRWIRKVPTSSMNWTRKKVESDNMDSTKTNKGAIHNVRLTLPKKVEDQGDPIVTHGKSKADVISCTTSTENSVTIKRSDEFDATLSNYTLTEETRSKAPKLKFSGGMAATVPSYKRGNNVWRRGPTTSNTTDGAQHHRSSFDLNTEEPNESTKDSHPGRTSKIDVADKRRYSKFHHGQHRAMVKRIRLNPSNGVEGDNPPPNKPASYVLNEPTSSSDDKQASLTNFAYRSFSTNKKRQRPNQIINNRSTTLVRVNPNVFTPICSSVMKNVPCNDVTCTKRHDVPRDAAMPDCSFFQRDGMCLKENCPYRHIKVSDSAEICVDFVKTGFCLNESCLLKHVRRMESKNQGFGS